MKIAVPHESGQVFQHFGKTAQFKVYTVEGNRVQGSELLTTGGQGHGALRELLQSWGVTTVICGGIGPGAIDALASVGVTLYAGVSGGCDESVRALLDGTLVHNPDPKCGGHGHHDHGCGSH